jgi:hypothetical protein
MGRQHSIAPVSQRRRDVGRLDTVPPVVSLAGGGRMLARPVQMQGEHLPFRRQVANRLDDQVVSRPSCVPVAIGSKRSLRRSLPPPADPARGARARPASAVSRSPRRLDCYVPAVPVRLARARGFRTTLRYAGCGLQSCVAGPSTPVPLRARTMYWWPRCRRTRPPRSARPSSRRWSSTPRRCGST